MRAGTALRVGFLTLAVVAVYAFGLSARDGELRRVCTASCAVRPTYADANRRAPDFDIPDINGGRLRLADYRGKVVILNFWTKTCKPCLDEMPALSELATILREDQPDIVLLTISQDESAEDIRNTLGAVVPGEPAFPVGVDSDAAVIREMYGTKLFPETWFIDPDGIIRARIDGPRSNWNSPLIVDFAASLRDPLRCPITFEEGAPHGAEAGLCKDVSPSG